MNKAFTLIELLVVVLIIGILSAIALPQYTKAVEKSRMAEALQIAASIRTGVDTYVLANDYQGIELVGDMSTTGKSGLLDIDVESNLNCTLDDHDKCCSKYFCFDAYCYPTGCTVSAGRYQNGDFENATEQYYLEWVKSKSTGQWTKSCGPSDDFPYSASICASFNAN